MIKQLIVTSLAFTVSAAVFNTAFGAESDSATQQKNSAIDELIITGEDMTPVTDIDPETELLLNVAGAGFDPLAALLSLPGVTFASDYSSEPAVRGSAPEDNGYYVDLIPARYVFHIFGHSIFNHNLIHSFDLYPAAFSSQYSNATGAIIDVRLRDPKNQRPTTTLDASFLGSGVLFESKITDNQAAYVSYRRSLIDQFIRDPEDIEDSDSGIGVDQIPVSDDYQMKYVWDINDQHQLGFIATGASDKVAATFRDDSNLALRDPDLTGPAAVDTRFDSQGLKWQWQNQNAARQKSSQFLLTHTTDEDDVRYGTGQFFNVKTERMMAAARWQQQLGNAHEIILGARVEETQFDINMRAKIPACSDFDPDCPTVDAPLIEFDDRFEQTSYVYYLEDVWQITDALALRAGIHHLSDDFLEASATEPRLRLDYSLNENWQFHIAHGEYSQIPQPEKISPATGNPELGYITSKHSVLGVQQQLADQWSWKAELYYKSLDNLPLSLSPATDPDFLDRYSNDASGEAYGIEFLINKKLTEKFYGWLALSLSKTERTNDRTGETQPFGYDRPVIINLVGNYKITENWMVGLKWSIQSGRLYTPITDTRPNTTDPTVIEPVYGELNSERLSPYHRLDLRTEYTRQTGYGFWSVFVDILNAYNAKNVEGYRYSPNEQDIISSTPDGFGDNVPVTRSEGLGFFPSIGFKIQF